LALDAKRIQKRSSYAKGARITEVSREKGMEVRARDKLTIAVGVKSMPKEMSEDCQLPCCPGAGLVCICIET